MTKMTDRIKTLFDLDTDTKEALHFLKQTRAINPAQFMRDAIREKLIKDYGMILPAPTMAQKEQK
jgi:hypothetical protein